MTETVRRYTYTTRRKLFFLLLYCTTSYGSPLNVFTLWPGVSIGYNIKAGVSFGVSLGATVLNYKVVNQKGAFGADVSFELFHSRSFVSKEKTRWYRLYSVSFLNTFNNKFMLKIGGGKTWTKWGRDNVNKSKHPYWGRNIDISYAPVKNGVFFGFHHCKVNTQCIGFDMKSSNIIYGSYKYPVRYFQNGFQFGASNK